MSAESSSEISKSDTNDSELDSDSRSKFQINHIDENVVINPNSPNLLETVDISNDEDIFSESIPGNHSTDQEVSDSKHDDNSIGTHSSGGLDSDNVITDQVEEVGIHEDNSTGVDNSSEVDSANQGTDQGVGVSIHSIRSKDEVNAETVQYSTCSTL